MDTTETADANIRFSLRECLTLIVLVALSVVALSQYWQNQKLQHRIDTLSWQVQHLSAIDEQTRERFDQLVAIVSDEPILGVPEVSN